MEFKQNKLEHLKSTLTVTKTKKMEDGQFEAVLTTGDLDRHGEIVSSKGLMIPKNQVIKMYYNHETNGTSLPIGKWLSIWKNGDKTMGRGEIDLEDEFAVKVYKKIQKGYIDSISIGFYPLEYDGDSSTWTKSTLVEASVVAEPANVNAIVTNKDMGMTQTEFKQLIKVHLKAEKPELPTDVEPIIDESDDGQITVKRFVKGAVMDVLTEPKKWDLMKPYYEVMYAFEEAYYDEDVPATDFEKLLNETISILQQVANGSYDITKSSDSSGASEESEIKTAVEELKSKVGALEAAVKASDEEPAIKSLIKVRVAAKQVDKTVGDLNKVVRIKLKGSSNG